VYIQFIALRKALWWGKDEYAWEMGWRKEARACMAAGREGFQVYVAVLAYL
jgi:hypothetical protein